MSWFSQDRMPTQRASTGTPNGDAIVVDHVTKKYGDFIAVTTVS